MTGHSTFGASIRLLTCMTLLGITGTPRLAVAQGDDLTPAEAEIMAVVDTSLERISNEDLVGLPDLMLEGAVVASARLLESGDAAASISTRAEQRATSVDGDFVERGFDPEVRISGPLAMVWLPYDFYRDGAWSHCGVDVFTLLRMDEGWRIATITYSVEQPPACEPHPEGPPGR